MILPDKYIPESNTLLAIGGILLTNLHRRRTLSSLWSKVRKEKPIGSFERFVLAVDFLFILGAVKFENGFLVKATGDDE